jgi:hypothetical protein
MANLAEVPANVDVVAFREEREGEHAGVEVYRFALGGGVVDSDVVNGAGALGECLGVGAVDSFGFGAHRVRRVVRVPVFRASWSGAVGEEVQGFFGGDDLEVEDPDVFDGADGGVAVADGPVVEEVGVCGPAVRYGFFGGEVFEGFAVDAGDVYVADGSAGPDSALWSVAGLGFAFSEDLDGEAFAWSVSAGLVSACGDAVGGFAPFEEFVGFGGCDDQRHAG